MDRIERIQWVAAAQAFYDAYIAFRIEGKETHYVKLNNRSFEIDFDTHGDYITVVLYCADVDKALSDTFNQSPRNTEETIRKLHWLAWEAEERYTYAFLDAEDEYQWLREILVSRYRLCYDDPFAGDSWKDIGEEEFAIELHNRQIIVHFSPDAMWDENGYIVAHLCCPDTDRRCMTVIHQKEDDPEHIIRLIQDMATEPEVLECSTADSEWEHELIRNYLVGSRTKDGLQIERYPFRWVCSWDGVVIIDRLVVLNNRQIRIQFEAQRDSLQMIVHCAETGKSFMMNLPKQCRNADEIGEEFVWKIQELAWEDV